MIKNILTGTVSVLLGLIFIFSAYTKLFPIELFEFSFIEIKVANWTTAPYIARFLLAFEFFIGVLLIFNFKGGNRLVPKITIGLLLVFTIYLLAIIFWQGNSGNCGCFGTMIKMTPLESIIKNILLISLCLVLFVPPPQKNLSSHKTVIWTSALACFALPFIVNPVSLTPPPNDQAINYDLKLAPLYDQSRKDIPTVDLMQGKRIIAFLSLTCPHCKIGAHKLNLIHQQHPNIPIYFILNGEDYDLKPFIEESKTTDIEYCFMSLKEGFIDNAGLNLPAILWVKNGKVVNRTRYTELNADDLVKWYEQED